MESLTGFDLRSALLAFDEADAAMLREYLALLDEVEPFSRNRVEGHFTGSAFVVSSDGLRTALTHHRKLGRWLQPGGHADGDCDLRRVALRETGEETGLTDLGVEDGIFDIDRHWIPDRPGESGHWHYDVRFVVRAGDDECFTLTQESNALAWWPIEQVANDAAFDLSLRRMATRWLERRDS
jgi:8-oxo-dGTP pyrophosphatase MutT (NUDIX family)